MSKAEIIAELPSLLPEGLVEIRSKLDELTGDSWLQDCGLTDDDKATLDSSLAEYAKDPDAGSSWADVKARLQSRTRK